MDSNLRLHYIFYCLAYGNYMTSQLLLKKASFQEGTFPHSNCLIVKSFISPRTLLFFTAQINFYSSRKSPFFFRFLNLRPLLLLGLLFDTPALDRTQLFAPETLNLRNSYTDVPFLVPAGIIWLLSDEVMGMGRVTWQSQFLALKAQAQEGGPLKEPTRDWLGHQKGLRRLGKPILPMDYKTPIHSKFLMTMHWFPAVDNLCRQHAFAPRHARFLRNLSIQIVESEASAER